MGGRQILDFAGAIDSLGVPVGARGQDAVLFKLRGNLLRSDPFQRHAVNPPHDPRRFLVHDPAFGVLRVFDVPVRRLPHGFTGIALDLVADAPLLADVARIPFVEKIADGSQLVFTFVAVDVVRNSDQPNVVIRKELLGQSADLDVVTPQAAEIFYKHCRRFSLLQLLNHIGKAGTIHRNAGDAVVKKMNQVRVAFFLCDLDEQFFLIPYAVALSVHVIVTGKPLIQKGGHVTGFFVVIRLFHAVLLSGQPNSNTCIPQQVYHCLALLSCMRRGYAPPPGTTPPQIPISSGAEGRSPMCSASPP